MIQLDAIRAARERIEDAAIRTPLVRIEVDSPREVYLKLENLQPIGSFKLRGAANAMLLAPGETLSRGVYTASAGNMAQGVAWCARRFGIPCTVIVPERAPQVKIDAVERLGGRVMKVPFDAWWQTMVDHRYPGVDGLFVHPFSDPNVMAGNGTIGLEILEDLPDVDAVLVPWGGGGLSCGIASAMRGMKSGASIHPIEVDTAAPLFASFVAGMAVEITPLPSFVDGMGGKSVFPEMWTLAAQLVEPPLVVSVPQIEEAIRVIARRARVVAEGAGAAGVAAIRLLPPDARKVVCVVSGGNLDPRVLSQILDR